MQRILKPKPDKLMRVVARLLAVGFALSISHAIADEPEFDPRTGYRIARYRSPTPESVPGGRRIVAADVPALIRDEQAILVDVMPTEGGRADPETGEWYLPKRHSNIAGSAWLADVGFGHITAEQSKYFSDHLAALTFGQHARALIFYCMADCWMSWNAVQRATALGYTNVYWLSEGTDGWQDWGGELVDAKPLAVSRVKQEEK